MSITVTESEKSRRIEWYDTTRMKRVELLYDVSGTDDPIAAQEALVDVLETDEHDVMYGTLPISGISADPETADSSNSLGIWRFVVTYEQSGGGGSSEEEVAVSFDTTGGTRHITQSKATRRYWPSAVTYNIAPDFKGAIGVTNDSVEGVDITEPVFKFSVTRQLDDDQVTQSYIGSLYNLTGKVNASRFKAWGVGSFEVGELLFLGATGASRRGKYSMQYQFAASKNVALIPIGEIVVERKLGWEYLWIRYGDQDDGEAKTIVKVPISAYVEQVYDFGDFNELNPPSAP